MEDITKIVKSLADSGLLLKGVSETIQNEAKEQKGLFLSMFFGILGEILLGNMLAGKITNRAGESYESRLWIYKKGFLILLHPLNNFEIQEY